MFAKVIDKASRGIEPIVHWVNNVGVIVLALMMLLTATDVILRYFFNRPILGSYELNEFMMSVLAACTIAYAARLKAHVNVDLAVTLLPGTVQAVIGGFTSLVCVVFFALMSWRSIHQSGILHQANSVSASLSIPEYPFVLVLGIGFGVASLVFLLQLLESIGKAFGKWTR